MKKIIALLLVLMLLLSLCACGGNSSSENAETPTANNRDPAAEQSVDLAWELTEFVDDFGDPIGEAYLRSVATGTFSNTATLESELAVGICFEPTIGLGYSLFAFQLMEYGRTKATYSDSNNIIIKVKIGDDVYSDILLGTTPNGDVILRGGPSEGPYHSECFNAIYSALKEAQQEIRCVIEIGSSKYTFSINSDNFVNSTDELGSYYGLEGDLLTALLTFTSRETIDSFLQGEWYKAAMSANAMFINLWSFKDGTMNWELLVDDETKATSPGTYTIDIENECIYITREDSSPTLSYTFENGVFNLFDGNVLLERVE